MGDRKLKMAVIGCGRIALEGHLPYMKRHRDVEVVAAVDVVEAGRNKAAKEFDIPATYDNPVEMFDRESPDAVVICTPSWAHCDLTVMAAERGAHVLCEKPMAATTAECRRMIDACESAGVFLQIGMVKRFDAGIAKAKKMAISGKLGNVSQIAAYSMNPPVMMDSPFMSVAREWMKVLGQDFDAKTGWWRYSDPRAGGGHMLEMGTHMMDMVLYWTGEIPSDYSGFINKKRSDMIHEDQGTLLLKFPSGVVATVEVNMSVTADNFLGEKARIYGDKGSLSVNHFHGMWFGIPFFEYIPTRLVHYGAVSPYLGIGLPLRVKTGKAVYMHKLQTDYFVDRSLGRDTDYFGFGPDIAATGCDGLAVIQAIEKAYESESKSE